ncbi:bile acid:sodium symporter family protein [Aeromicrobium alkaliterrae]|uniref:Bile acid:sodium symporter n=1 Tax=Aeromicrobium alkaliterrae TaxID=302168 RepID=A0ABN2JWD5_9ACTN
MRLDPFLLLLLGAAGIGTFLPATGDGLDVVKVAATVTIGLLFFLYGTRLSTAETLRNLRHWKLQLAIMLTTFAFFPALGLGVRLLPEAVVPSPLTAGVLLLCLVPSTVQGCVVYTRIARGNTAAAVVSASMSNLVGVFLVPLYVALLMGGDAHVDGGAVLRIVAQLFAPFVAGQLVRPLIGRWVERNDGWLKRFDRSTILLVVYVAFSEGAEADIWTAVPASSFAIVAAICAVLLAVALTWTTLLGRWCRFERPDRMALLFCGSTKSLASGLPMVAVLFPGSTAALIVLPLMIYHQMQLLVSSVLAERLGRTAPDDDA